LLLVLAIAGIYAISGFKLRRTYAVDVVAMPIPTDAASIAEGRRMARILGCYKGCHGKEAEGGVLFGNTLPQRLLLGHVTAPDLTRAVHELSDEDLVRVVRHGVLPNGRSVDIMPSIAFRDLSDADLGNIIAFLRSLQRSDGPGLEGQSLGLLPRTRMAIGQWEPPAHTIDHDAPRLDPGGPSDPVARGRYLTHIACAGCHDRDLSGGRAGINVAVVADYTLEEFRTLVRTLTPPGKTPPKEPTDFELRFAGFTDPEIDAMYAYIGTALAQEQQAQAATEPD
jgi:mono/diheme cytochrome c family protein